MLKIQSFGNKSDFPDLLIVHGLFGSGRNWRAIARNISSDRQVHIVDMRNHGESFGMMIIHTNLWLKTLKRLSLLLKVL